MLDLNSVIFHLYSAILISILFVGLSIFFHYKQNKFESLYYSFIAFTYNLFLIKSFSMEYADFVKIKYIFLSITLISFALLVKNFSFKLTRSLQDPKKIIHLLIMFLFLIAAANPLYSGPGNSNTIARLASPLKGDHLVVAKGGNNYFINHHILNHNQKYALDIIKECPDKNNELHLKNENFCIWNEAVYTPCEGTIQNIENNISDNRPFFMNKQFPKGNFVEIVCENGFKVTLAHFRKGSLIVQKGSKLETGMFLGRVGNSGNSSEPHLHFQANFNKEPALIELNGRSYMAGEKFP